MEKLETAVTSFLCKICFEVTMPNFETSSSYLESGATFSFASLLKTYRGFREARSSVAPLSIKNVMSILRKMKCIFNLN